MRLNAAAAAAAEEELLTDHLFTDWQTDCCHVLQKHRAPSSPPVTISGFEESQITSEHLE